MCSEVEAGKFYNTGIHRVTQLWQKYVENGEEILEKKPYNYKRCMNYPSKFNFNFTYIF
jgi:hypothetical protein